MALWKESDGWNVEPDADTTEEMLEIAAEERTERLLEARRNRLLWEKHRDRFGRNGELVIRPPATGSTAADPS